MDVPIRYELSETLNNVMQFCLEFGDKSLNSVTNLVLKAKAIIFSSVNENLLLYCQSFRDLLSLSIFSERGITKKHRL